jgi:hypothetical protein
MLGRSVLFALGIANRRAVSLLAIGPTGTSNFLSVVFNLVNGGLQGGWLYRLSPAYPAGWAIATWPLAVSN